MTDDDPGDPVDGTTVWLHGYPTLDFLGIVSVNCVFFVGVVALTVHGWQLLVRNGAVLIPGIIGAVVAFGAILIVPFLVDLDSE